MDSICPFLIYLPSVFVLAHRLRLDISIEDLNTRGGIYEEYCIRTNRDLYYDPRASLSLDSDTSILRLLRRSWRRIRTRSGSICSS
jgi:hypothetical protein